MTVLRASPTVGQIHPPNLFALKFGSKTAPTVAQICASNCPQPKNRCPTCQNCPTAIFLTAIFLTAIFLTAIFLTAISPEPNTHEVV